MYGFDSLVWAEFNLTEKGYKRVTGVIIKDITERYPDVPEGEIGVYTEPKLTSAIPVFRVIHNCKELGRYKVVVYTNDEGRFDMYIKDAYDERRTLYVR